MLDGLSTSVCEQRGQPEALQSAAGVIPEVSDHTREQKGYDNGCNESRNCASKAS
jgi:hypothetical protein